MAASCSAWPTYPRIPEAERRAFGDQLPPARMRLLPHEGLCRRRAARRAERSARASRYALAPTEPSLSPRRVAPPRPLWPRATPRALACRVPAESLHGHVDDGRPRPRPQARGDRARPPRRERHLPSRHPSTRSMPTRASVAAPRALPACWARGTRVHAARPRSRAGARRRARRGALATHEHGLSEGVLLVGRWRGSVERHARARAEPCRPRSARLRGGNRKKAGVAVSMLAIRQDKAPRTRFGE